MLISTFTLVLGVHFDASAVILTDLAVHVGDATVALSCPVKLADLVHTEALCEGLPHTGA